MHVITSEVHVDLVDRPLSITSPPDCGCGEYGGCSDCGVTTLTIDAGERDDGASPQRVVLRGRPDDLRRMLREALIYVDMNPSSD